MHSGATDPLQKWKTNEISRYPQVGQFFCLHLNHWFMSNTLPILYRLVALYFFHFGSLSSDIVNQNLAKHIICVNDPQRALTSKRNSRRTLIHA